MTSLTRFSSRMIARNARTMSTRVAGVETQQPCEAMNKLKNALEQYRKENFSRETPIRFKKEVLCAAASVHGDALYNKNASIRVERINDLLHNIGLDDKQLSKDELDALVTEIGDNSSDRTISIQKMMSLL